MPFNSSYLLIIDNDASKYESIAEYFIKFHYRIIYKQDVLKYKIDKPLLALLINAEIAPDDFFIITELYKMRVPLIVISDSIDEELCISMLEAGADDFIVKSINPRELHARITTISRRLNILKENTKTEAEIIFFGQWRLYPLSRQVFDEKNEELRLSAGEYDLLLAFISNPGIVLEREFLLKATKQSSLNLFDRRIDVQISRLRQKIEIDAKRPGLIKTIRNGGYLFTGKVSVSRSKDI